MRRGLLVVAVLSVLLGACFPLPPADAPSGGGGGGGGGSGPPPPPPIAVKLTPVTAIGGAITMAVRGSDTGLYIGTKDGRVLRSAGAAPTTVLDISATVNDDGECGLLGMTFNAAGDRLYVHYTTPDGGTCNTTNVVEYVFDPGTMTANTPRALFTATHPATNHKGGSLLLGPDGLLYISIGEGGVSSNAQVASTTSNNPLGKILRFNPVDPDAGGPLTHTTPTDNPFYEPTTLDFSDLVWSYGLRNPFRMSFDRATGDLWLGDVGASTLEEIDWSPSASMHGRGVNFGWDCWEGDVPGPGGCGVSFTNPVLTIDRSAGDRSVIGGYVYRGSAIPALQGRYLFSDFFNNSIRMLRINGSGAVLELAHLVNGPANLASFGEDLNGELYVLSLSDGVFRIEPV